MRPALVLLQSAQSPSSLRVFALPLARQKHFTYFHPQRLTNPHDPPHQVGLLTKGTTFMSNAWTKFGNAPEGNWRYRIYMFGEKMMDRIEFEEWALKALDVEFAPKPWKRRIKDEPVAAEVSKEKEGLVAGAGLQTGAVPLIYPPSLLQPQEILSHLQSHLQHRILHHRKYMIYSAIGAPLTLPVALLPIIPNLPGFYLLWRAWSHWRALKASQYLSDLIEHHQLVPTPSSSLDETYGAHTRTSSRGRSWSDSDNESNPELESQAQHQSSSLLLTQQHIPNLVSTFDLGDAATGELNRAVEQASARLRKLVQDGALQAGNSKPAGSTSSTASHAPSTPSSSDLPPPAETEPTEKTVPTATKAVPSEKPSPNGSSGSTNGKRAAAEKGVPQRKRARN